MIYGSDQTLSHYESIAAERMEILDRAHIEHRPWIDKCIPLKAHEEREP